MRLAYTKTMTTIIIFVLIVHALILLFLLVWYHTPQHAFIFDQFIPEQMSNSAETIFYDSPQSIAEPIPQKKEQSEPPLIQEDEIPGTFKPRASTLADSMALRDAPSELLRMSGEEEENITSPFGSFGASI